MTQAPPTRSSILRRWAQRAGPWIFLAAAVWWFGSSLQGDAVSSGPAPPLTLTLSDGTPFDLAEQHGRVIVLNFWAAWCPPCRAEAPALSRVHRAVQRRGAQVLGLAVDAISLSRARRLGMDYPQALATQDDLERFGVQMLPTTVVVGPDGQVVRSFVGEIDEETLREVVEGAARAEARQEVPGSRSPDAMQ